MVNKAKSHSSTLAKDAFGSSNRHLLDAILPSGSARFVRNSKALSAIIWKPQDKWFLDLLRKLLVIDPTERSTAHECLTFLARIRRNVVRYA
jgi:serine/threonine protein kinase